LSQLIGKFLLILKNQFKEKQMKKIYTDEQIVGFVREAEKTEITIAEFCRQKGFNEGTFYKWKKRFGSMQVQEVKRLRELESENARLKRLLADRMIEIDAMQELLAKKW
jgi:putative transposase